MTNESSGRQSRVVAFYSSSDGAGRSCMVANIALILASLGHQVLAVDHDLTSPSLHRYLSAFLPATPANAPRDLPVRLECEFAHSQGTIDFLGPAADEAITSDSCVIRRPDLLALGYDIVLVDTPAGARPSPIAEELADIVVLGFTLNQRNRNRAEQLAREIEASPRGNYIRILPIPMRVDRTAVQATTQRRVKARDQFDWLLAGLTDTDRQRYWDEVEIPDEPEYTDEEALPVLHSPSPQRDRLAGAYLGLARRLLPETPSVTTFEAPESVREKYGEARQESTRHVKTITILHAAADRYWAEWIAAELQAMGYTAVRRRIDQFRPEDPPTGATLIVVSARLRSLPGMEDLLRRVIDQAQADSQVPGAITIDGTWLPSGVLPDRGKVSLGKNAEDARRTLASYYQVSGPIPPPLKQLNFPSGKEKISVNLPVFTLGPAGRDDIIDQIRDHFTARETPPLTLMGPAGADKTQMALEYAYRFRAYYDVIAVIRADSPEAVQTGLAQLKAQISPRKPAGDPRTALESLTSMRCLLIYSGADDPPALDGLVVKADDIHVLLTAREAVRDGPTLPVPRLPSAEAAAIVSGMVGGILPDDAAWVADAMGGIPLALRLAGAWFQVNEGRLSGFDADPATLTQDVVGGLKSTFAGESGDDFDPIEFTVRLHLDELAFSGLGKAATLLLETCAFLGSSGLPWQILRSAKMLARLADEYPEMSDPILLPSVLNELARRGLLLLDEAELLPGDITRVPLRVHPRVLDVVRNRLDPEPRAERMTWVSTLLAASVPTGIVEDVIEGQDLYAELQEHVVPSGAITQTDDAVRRWLVNQVRFLWQSDTRSSREAAVKLGESLRNHWLSALPGDEAADDPIMLRLSTQLANVYRSLRWYSQAREMDEDTLVRLRRVLGLEHPRTLMTARSYGADLRRVGDFEEALLTDQTTWQLAAQTLGRNHPITLTASGNLALSELLAGEPEHALQRRLEQDLPWCERFEAQRPEQVAWVLGHIGVLQRELGRYEDSLESLLAARDGFQRAVSGGTSAPSSLVALRVDSDIAIAERRLGEPQLDWNRRILEQCRTAPDETDPLLWAVVLSLAGDLAELGRPVEAVRSAQEALDGHDSVFGPNHPFTSINRVNLANYALAAGQPDLADEMSGSAHASLESSLGPRHLWTVASAVSRANVLAVTGHLEEAAALEERILSAYKVRLGTHHPFTQVATENSRHTHWLRNEPRSAIDPVAEARRRRAIELNIPPY